MDLGGRAAVITWLACTVPVPLPAIERALPELASAVDVDPSPDRVEVHLEALVTELRVGEQRAADVWAYRDTSAPVAAIPGPTIAVQQGQQLSVHLHNALPQSTTLHLHGVALPNDMDGSELTQMVVRPGESHHHDFVVTHPGTFWYHPHFDVADQMARGLYGLGVSSGDDDLHETADRTLLLVDLLLDEAGQPIYEVDPEVWRAGRQGTVVLVNGALAGEDLVLHTTARERWRILDAAHSRYFALTLEGHDLLVVGGDGGPARTPWRTDTLVVAPGDRYEVVVEMAPEARAVLWSMPVDRGFGLPPDDPVPLFTVIGPEQRERLPPLPETRPGMPRVVLPAEPAIRTWSLTASDAPNGEPLFAIDGTPWPFAAPVPVREGDVEVWEVHNCTDGHQPFHLHGLFFDVLDIDGRVSVHDAREDVADIPPYGVLRMAVPYEVPGQWMLHSHLLDQASHGMMAAIDVGPWDPAPSAEPCTPP